MALVIAPVDGSDSGKAPVTILSLISLKYHKFPTKVKRYRLSEAKFYYGVYLKDWAIWSRSSYRDSEFVKNK